MCEWVLCFIDYSQSVCAVSEMTDCLLNLPENSKLLPQSTGVADTKPKSEGRAGKKQSCYHLDQHTLLHVALPVLGAGELCCLTEPFALLLQAHCREQVCKQWCYRAWGSAVAHCLMELWDLLHQWTLLMVMYLIRWRTVANSGALGINREAAAHCNLSGDQGANEVRR